jgi:hypothetical protein
MTDSEKVYMLNNALAVLLDTYKASVPNSCQCEYEDEEQCGYCYVIEILEKVEEVD